MGEVDVYPVGVLSDLRRAWGTLRFRGVKEAWRVLRYAQPRWWRSRGAWNGFLAEAEGVGHCGHGWTRKRALRSLERIQAGRRWIRHDCGRIRLGSLAVPRRYCVDCGLSTRRGWTAMPLGWDTRAADTTNEGK